MRAALERYRYAPGPRTRKPLALSRDEIWRLHQTATLSEVAKVTGLSLGTVKSAVLRYRNEHNIPPQHAGGRKREPGEMPPEPDHTDGKRCRCGLRLPCNNCLPPSAAAYAQRRMDP